MFFFDYIRHRACQAVLAGVQDALDQIDPQFTAIAVSELSGSTGKAPQLPGNVAETQQEIAQVATAPNDTSMKVTASPTKLTIEAPLPPSLPSQPTRGVIPTPTDSTGPEPTSLQERLAQSANRLSSPLSSPQPPANEEKPSAPKRGRGPGKQRRDTQSKPEDTAE